MVCDDIFYAICSLLDFPTSYLHSNESFEQIFDSAIACKSKADD